MRQGIPEVLLILLLFFFRLFSTAELDLLDNTKKMNELQLRVNLTFRRWRVLQRHIYVLVRDLMQVEGLLALHWYCSTPKERMITFSSRVSVSVQNVSWTTEEILFQKVIIGCSIAEYLRSQGGCRSRLSLKKHKND